jgi:hypothetical protein
MKKIFLYSATMALVIFQSLSCSKKSSSPSTCKLTDITIAEPSGAETFAITYNDAGKISTLVQTTTSSVVTKVFTYSGNVVLVSTTDNQTSNVVKDSIIVNSDGLMVSDLNTTGQGTSLTTYSYSGTEIQSVTFQQGTQPTSTTNYTFTNGDLTGGAGSTFTYNDKTSAVGDYLQIEQLATTGVPFIKTAHQCISIQSGSSLENFSYSYDNSGKITQMVVTVGANVATYGYTYDCNLAF